MSSRWFRFFVLVAILIAVLVLLTSLLGGGKGTSIIQRTDVNSTVATAVQTQDGKLLTLSNGGLVVFDHKSGSAERLLPTGILDTSMGIHSMSVSPDYKYIVFKTIRTAKNGPLNLELEKRDLPSSRGYWWLMDVSSQSFTPLDVNTLRAEIVGGDLYALLNNQGEYSIEQYDLPINLRKTTPILEATNFYVLDDGFLIVTSDNDLYKTTDGIVNTLYAENITPIGLMTNAFAFTTQEQGLTIIDALDGESTRVEESGVVGTPALHGNLVLYVKEQVKGKVSIILYDNAEKDKKPWDISENIGGTSSIGGIVYVLDKETALVSSTEKKYFLIGSYIPTIDTSLGLVSPE